MWKSLGAHADKIDFIDCIRALISCLYMNLKTAEVLSILTWFFAW